MLKFAANLSMMYTEHAFLDRYAAAAADGFAGVECMSPYEAPAARARAPGRGGAAPGADQHAGRRRRAAIEAWPRCPAGKTSFALAWSRRWPMPTRWPARRCM